MKMRNRRAQLYSAEHYQPLHLEYRQQLREVRSLRSGLLLKPQVLDQVRSVLTGAVPGMRRLVRRMVDDDLRMIREQGNVEDLQQLTEFLSPYARRAVARRARPQQIHLQNIACKK